MVRWWPQRKPRGPQATEPSRWRWVRRSLVFLTWLLADMLLLLAFWLMLAPTRGLLLGAGLGLANRALPGELQADHARWPALNRIELGGLLWTTVPAVGTADTLVALDSLMVVVDLPTLRHRDVALESVLIDGRLINLPGILAALADTGATAGPDSAAVITNESTQGFPREGSVAPVPSIAVQRFDVTLGHLQASADLAVADIVGRGQVELRTGRTAGITLEHLAARTVIAVGDTAAAVPIHLDLAHAGLGMTLTTAPDSLGRPHLVGAVLDSLTVEAGPSGSLPMLSTWKSAGPVRLEARGTLAVQGRRFLGDLDSSFRLPDTEHFRAILPDSFPHRDFGDIEGQLAFDGSFERPSLTGRVRLDLGASEGLEHGLVVADVSVDLDALESRGLGTVTARLDTLDLGLQGARVRGSAAVEEGKAALDLRFNLPADGPHRPFLPATPPLAGIGDVAGRLKLTGGFADPTAEMQLRLDLSPSARVDRCLLVGSAIFDADSVRLRGVAALTARLDTLELGIEESYLRGSAALDRGTVALDLDFALPADGPRHLFLPDTLAATEIGDLAGQLVLAGRYVAPKVAAQLRLDLTPSAKLDRGLIVGTAAFDTDSLRAEGLRALTARLDTLDLALLDASMRGSASIDDDGIAADLTAELGSAVLPRLFLPYLEEDSQLELGLTTTVSGTLEDPTVALDLRGSADVPGVRVGKLRLVAAGDVDDLEVRLDMGEGIVYQGSRLDSLSAAVKGRVTGLDSLRIGFGLAAWRDAAYVGIGGEAVNDTLRSVRLDSLVLRGGGQGLRLQQPATIAVGPGQERLRVSGLDLKGDIGNVILAAHWDSTSTGLLADVDLLLTEALLQAFVPAALWSADGGMDLQVVADLALEGQLDDPRFTGAAGVRAISHRNKPTLGIDLGFRLAQGDSAGLVADLGISTADTVLLRGDLVWPGRADLSAGAWLPDNERDLVVRIPDQALDLGLLNRALPADFGVGGQMRFGAEVAMPAPGFGRTVGADSLSAAPTGGRITGHLSSAGLPVTLPNRSRMQVAMDLEFSGPVADPVVGGKITVESGFFRIPEIPRNLHPIEGESLLWDLHDSTLARIGAALDGGDTSLVFSRPETLGPTIEPTGPAYLPDLDLEVVIANNLRINGYGLEIQLGGDMKVKRGFDAAGHPYPKLSGRIANREGTLTFMNRKFKVERGIIEFHGAIPPDPILDMMLEAHVGNNTVRILVSGTAGKPVVELTSDPDMNEADIMAVLLFGRSLNDLDNEQRGAARDEGDPAKELRENLAGLAMAFGTAGIQDSMTQAMGVDMVGMGSDSKGDATFMVGKFLTPEVMIKYQQSLEKSGTYFMTLEYSLSQYFKLVSTYGQGEEASGAEVKWTRRY